MRPPNKSRSRNKNNRRNNNNSGGNVLNRVYDSAGPDGRVRGTPVQVIEKYQALAHDNSLAGDRVAMENFQQHAEHYIRLINEAQRQIAERREAMESQMAERSNNQQQQRRKGGDDVTDDPANAPQPEMSPQPEASRDALDVQSDQGAPELVDTPEASAEVKKPKPKPRTRAPRKAPKAEAAVETPSETPAASE